MVTPVNGDPGTVNGKNVKLSGAMPVTDHRSPITAFAFRCSPITDHCLPITVLFRLEHLLQILQADAVRIVDEADDLLVLHLAFGIVAKRTVPQNRRVS